MKIYVEFVLQLLLKQLGSTDLYDMSPLLQLSKKFYQPNVKKNVIFYSTKITKKSNSEKLDFLN